MANEVVKYEPGLPAKSQGALKAILSGPGIMSALAEVAPRHLTPERVVKMVLMAASRQPKLLECSQESILKAAMTSSELGLECSGTLGRAYLVPFKNGKTGRMEAQFMAGYLGLMDLARRSGEIESISAEVVYEQDTFIYEKGLDERLVHKPDLEADQNDKDIVGAYMIARFRPSGHHIEYMTRKQIEKIRSRSKAANSGPWVSDYAAMCKKTVLRAGLKFCPLSIETQHAIAKTDDEFSDGVVTAQVIHPTDGRQKWGQPQESADTGFGFGDQQTQEEPPPPEEQPSEPSNEISAGDRNGLLRVFIERLNSKGVKAQNRQAAAIADLCKAVGTDDIEGIKTLDQYNAALNYIDEVWPG